MSSFLLKIERFRYKYEADIKTSKYKKDIKYYKDLAQKAKDGDIPTTDIDKKTDKEIEE